MSDISRRDALRRLALSLTATGFVDRVAAQEVHQMAGAGAGRRRRRLHAEGASRARVPDARAADRSDHSGRERRARRGRGRRRGLDRHDGERERRAEGELHEGPRLARHDDEAARRRTTSSARRRREQTALLDLIAYRRNQTAGAGAGHRVLHLGPADDRRRVLHERDRHQGHRLPRQHATDRPIPRRPKRSRTR